MPGPSTDLYALMVRFDLLDGHQDAFDTLVTDTLAHIRAEEPGTLGYVIHRDATSHTVRIFYELYRDITALEAHEATQHGRRFLAEREAHLRSAPEVWKVTPFEGVLREDLLLGGA